MQADCIYSSVFQTASVLYCIWFLEADTKVRLFSHRASEQFLYSLRLFSLYVFSEFTCWAFPGCPPTHTFTSEPQHLSLKSARKELLLVFRCLTHFDWTQFRLIAASAYEMLSAQMEWRAVIYFPVCLTNKSHTIKSSFILMLCSASSMQFTSTGYIY